MGDQDERILGGVAIHQLCNQRALARADLPRSRFHDIRHATATFLLAQGFTLEDAKQQLGHSSIVLTSNTYGHVLQERQHKVARTRRALRA